VWWRLKLRYVLDPAIPEYRAFLAGMEPTTNPNDPGLLCLLMFSRTDRLFRDVTLDAISPLLAHPDTLVDVDVVDKAIRAHAEASGHHWSPTTLLRSRGHLLSTLKDFGVLRGSLTKRTVKPEPSTSVALFGTRLARLEGLSDRQLIDARWFKLLGLHSDQVIDLFYNAARTGALSFRIQADVVELSLPPLEGEG
jgi:hypothetical protein